MPARSAAAVTLATSALGLALARPAAACTEVVVAGRYGYAYPSETMSSRTLDFPFLGDILTWFVAYVPEGTVINRAKTRSTAPTPPAKHGFVCIAGDSVVARVNAGYGPTQPGMCADGLNTAGLSGSYLWQEQNEGNNSHTGYAADVATDALTVGYWDFISVVLGTCDAVACVRDFVATVPIVTTKEIQRFSKGRFGTDFLPLHATFTDADGATVAVEWTGVKGSPVVTPNPTPNGGVFTNGGTYPYLQELTAAYVQQANTTFTPVYEGNLYQASYPGGLVWGNQISNSSPAASSLVDGQLPLSIQNSASRFVRTSMLRDLVGPVAWGSPTDLMSPEAYGTMTAAAMQADGIMNSAAIPAKYPKCMPKCDPNQSPEAEGSNVYSGQNEVSLWRTLRDHKRATFSIKTVYNPTYYRIDLKKYLAVAPPKVATVKPVTDVVPGTWWQEAPLPGAAAVLNELTAIKDAARGALGGVEEKHSPVDALKKAESTTKAAALKAQLDG